MSTALSLAARLRRASDRELFSLLIERDIASSGITDFFDLTEVLLDSESVHSALTHLDRRTLAAIAVVRTSNENSASLDEVVKRLQNLRQTPAPNTANVRHYLEIAHRRALVEMTNDTVMVYDAVAERLDAWPREGLPDAPSLASGPQPAVLAPVSYNDRSDVDSIAAENMAAERAFATVTAITEIVSELSRESAKELNKGGLSLPDAKRIASRIGCPLEEVGPVMSIASQAELIVLDGNQWVPSAASDTWLAQSFSGRWRMLAESWLTRLPDDIRQVLTDLAEAEWGEHLVEHVRWLYPAGGDWMTGRIRTHAHSANLLGIADAPSHSNVGRLMLTKGMDAAQDAAEAAFPPTVNDIYLQNDLSAISAGPLEASIDARMRMLADVEARGLASTYRFSTESITRALSLGESAASILTFLGDISLTGIPQPVHYLVSETASRYGLVRVGAVEHTAQGVLPTTMRSYVHSDDRALLHTIAVDRTLANLAFRRTSDSELVSRFTSDVVFWALTDARYPAAAEDTTGTIINPQRRRPQETNTHNRLSDSRLLIERLRSTAADFPEGDEQAWLVRQLEVAIRNKLPVIITVTMPNGDLSDFLLEPASVARGRVRARDRSADIERTLPLTSIHAIRAAE